MNPIEDQFLLKKFPGKGGWTYVAFPEIKPNNKQPFGWVTVKGYIDGYELKQYKLMPMGNRTMFLPVNSKIRKVIKKEAGDYVSVKLELDNSEYSVPLEILDCVSMEAPNVQMFFDSLKNWEKKAYVDWIYDAKTIDTKTKRIVKMMEKLDRGLKFHEKQ